MFKEKYGLVSAPSTSQVQLQDSLLLLSGQWRRTGLLTLSTATGLDTGAIAASSFYYLYLVMVGGVMSLKASLSAQKPLGITTYKKVGAFYTDGSSNVFRTYSYGDEQISSLNAKFTSGGITSDEGPIDWVQGNCSLNNTSEYVIAIKTEYQTVVPMTINVEGWNSTAGVIQYSHMAISAVNSITIQIYNGAGRSQQPFQVTAHRAGIDAVQPDWKDY